MTYALIAAYRPNPLKPCPRRCRSPTHWRYAGRVARGTTKDIIEYAILCKVAAMLLSTSNTQAADTWLCITQTLRPKLTLVKTYAEAEAAVRMVQEEMRAKMLAKQSDGVRVSHWRVP